MQLSPDIQHWLGAFRAAHGRAPRILHIGNIANNAYNNAKLLNEIGLDCDVICYDYYHIMGCPEWEDADFSNDYGDQFKPDWVAAGVKDFYRFRWFAQGPVLDCIDYLVARKEGRTKEADSLWRKLEVLNGSRSLRDSGGWASWFRHYLRRTRQAFSYLATSHGIASRIAGSCDAGRVAALSQSEIMRLFFACCLMSTALAVRICAYPFRGLLKKFKPFSFDARVSLLIDVFANKYPSRKDKLSASDAKMYGQVSYQWQRLFEHYDLVQAYATDPILPMIADKQPYIGFEHGTLRTHTLRDNAVCRLTSLAYGMADHVFITNGDCLEYAHNIGITRFSPMLHPVDERRIEQIEGRYEELRRELGVRHVFLCTLRHDWAVKGTDQYIRALPELTKTLGCDFRVIMTRWGDDLGKSVLLAKELGVSELIVWIDPIPRRKLIQTLKSADILFDQIALPHFGATAPEGIAAGIPVIMSYDPKFTAWLVAEPAPILTAHNVADIAAKVTLALDPEWLKGYRPRAAKWFKENHSSRIVVQRHLDTYRQLIPID
jgi:glycosyltransferase involved in cell wall biosynthesis